MAFTVMPQFMAPAYAAAEPYEQVGTSYKIDGVTYYDIGDVEGKNFADPGEYNFLGRALGADIGMIDNKRLIRPTNTHNKSYTLSMCYDTIGCAVMDPKKDDSKYDGFIQLSRTMFKDLAQRVKGGIGERPDLAVDGDAWSSIDQGPMAGFFFYKSELTKASSMAQAEVLFEEYVRSKGRMNDYQRKFQDDTKAQTIFLTTFVMTLGSGKSNSSDQTKYAIAVIYNDFKITPLMPDDSVNGNYEVKDDEPVISNISIGSSVKNLTGETVNADQKIASASSATASSQVSGSRSYGFEESISIGTGMKFGLVSATMNVSFTASQTMESGWSREESCSEESSREHGVGVELPPHTAVMMNQKSVEKKRLTTYSCPVSVSCRVRVFGMGSHETQKPELKPMADIKSAKDLRQRAITNRGVIDTEGIDWDAIMKEDPQANTYSKSVNGIALARPTGRTEASFTESTKSVDGEVSNIKPIYPLSKIITTDKIYEYQMSSGDYTYIDAVDLEGLNTQNVDYYGFNPDRGEWKIVDSEGKPTGDKSIVSLEETPAKLTRLKANGPGTAWIKYYIDEEFYSTADHPGIFRKNADLSRTAIIEIQVEDKPFQGSIDVSGSFTGYVGDDYTGFTGEDGLQASVMDESGKELDRMVFWEAKELPSKGIEVKGNTIRFAKEGTFHVRAVSGEVTSDWVEVFGVEKPVPHTHSLKKVAAVTGNCSRQGVKEHYECTGCGQLFLDETADKEVTLNQIQTGYGEHKWDEGMPTQPATGEMSGVYTYRCENNPAHTRSEMIPTLLMTAKAKGKKGMTFRWTKVNKADGYEVFFARCGKHNRNAVSRYVATIGGADNLWWNRGGLKKNTAYKGYVQAYRIIDGRKTVIATSYENHSITGNGTRARSNVKKVTLKKSSLSLMPGETFRIRGAKNHTYKKAKKHLDHVSKFRYATTDASVATVSAKGVITAKGKGNCAICVIAHNGVYTTLAVTVK